LSGRLLGPQSGHCHPALVKAAKDQIDRLTLTSRAFHNDQMGPFLHELCDLTGYEKALPMNSNREWLIERHGHQTPVDVRQALTRKAA